MRLDIEAGHGRSGFAEGLPLTNRSTCDDEVGERWTMFRRCRAHTRLLVQASKEGLSKQWQVIDR